MKRLQFHLAIHFFILVIFSGCGPVSDRSADTLYIDLKDPTVQKIFDLQDRQLTDSLLVWLQSETPSYRYLAAMAFASIKDPAVIGPLSGLLTDDYISIRRAAAYSMGQIGTKEATPLLIEGFEANDTIGWFGSSNSAILEAVGKTGTIEELKLLSTTTTYRYTDTLLLLGQARGIYRFALRGITTPEGTERMLDLVKDQKYPPEVRVMAANYLYRATGIDFSGEGPELAQLIFKEDDPRIRMTLAIAIGKVGGGEVLAALQQRYRMETDYRVRCNILRALSNFPYEGVKEIYLDALKHPHTQVAITAAQQLIQDGDPADATTYWRIAKDSVHWNVAALLYEATHKHLPVYYADYRDAINAELRTRFRNTPNAYQKATYLQALAEFGWNYRFIQREGLISEDPIIRTAAAIALSKILSREDFNRFFGVSYRRVRREIGLYLKDGIRSGDSGVAAVAADALALLEPEYRDYLLSQDSNFLEVGKSQLKLPQQTETLYALEEALNVFKGTGVTDRKVPNYNHPIDWGILVKLRDHPRVNLETNRGTITLELLPHRAPGTVANFIKLVVDGYYTEKTFHRVVPNFVIQGGCPRGDGYGSLNFTIRSELSDLHYDRAGYVGMASAGNHTEGTQFFITHSPTPHLDGNYTIFARVVRGMSVVHATEIGDRIEAIEIL